MKLSQRKTESLNRIFTLGEINNENICKLVGLIYEVNKEDTNKETDKREIIKLILNSPGGNIYDGFAIIDVIEQSLTPIHIITHGQAQSMGFAIAICGHYRYATKRTTFMYHECGWDADYVKLSSHEQEIKEAKRLQQIYDEIVIENTNINNKMLIQTKKERKEWYMTAQEALYLGVIDEII